MDVGVLVQLRDDKTGRVGTITNVSYTMGNDDDKLFYVEFPAGGSVALVSGSFHAHSLVPVVFNGPDDVLEFLDRK